MVTKLKDNLSYIRFIHQKMKENFPDWTVTGKEAYQGQINDNFGISYTGNIAGYADSTYRVTFVKDRGQLELRIYNKNGNLIELGFLLYNFILEKMPNEDPHWGSPLCIELINCYVDFLKSYFEKKERKLL